jgi:hypothetical protein
MLFLTFTLAFITLLHFSLAIYFLPNGTAHEDEGTQPCSFDTTNPLHATCCHTKWENPSGGDARNGLTKDECLPNGLCRNRGMSTIAGLKVARWTQYYRVYCKNQDWSGCLKVYNNGVSTSEVRNRK